MSTDERPRRRTARALVLVGLIGVLIVVLFTTVFPWIEARLEDPIVGTAALR